MKKRILSVLLTACMVLTLLPAVAQPALAEGEGTGTVSNGAFTLIGGVNIISNADQLAYVAQQVNAGTYGWGIANYKLGNDINLSAYTNWTPIGNTDHLFEGSFDGGGRIISNLKISTTSSLGSSYGLFGEISGGTVKNVGLSGVNINVTSGANSLFVGGLAGNSDGTIVNCSVTGTITGTVTHSSVYFGGLVGRTMNGMVDNCYTTAAVSVTGAGTYSVGGLAGYNRGASISYSYWLSTATLTGVGSSGGSASETGNCGFTGTNTLAAAVTVGGTNTSSLLDALNAWLNNAARTDLYTWVSSGSCPVFGPLWTPPTYTATVTVKKDDGAFGSGAPTIILGTTVVNAVANGTSVANGTYNIYADGIDTGVNITVSGSAASVDLNYYTVTFKSQDGNTTLNTQTVLSGQTAVYGDSTPTKTATAQYTYEFSNWVTAANGSSSATLENITAQTTVYASFTETLRSYTITWKLDDTTPIDTTTVDYGGTPTHAAPTKTGYTFSNWSPAIASVAGAATYTATWTTNTYTISYTLNGGSVSTANPASYTVESADITLNNPTRTGYYFVGWSGADLTGSENKAVTISKGSTGNKSYTANWKADAPSEAPDTSIVTAKTDTSITITIASSDGYEYGVNGTWFSGAGSHTFNDLSANTEYDLVRRVAAVSTGNTSAASDASPALSVTTKAAPAVAPAAPTIGTGTDKPTSSSITISTAAGNEYYISASNTADWSGTPTGYFKANENGTHRFDGLTPTTQYYIHVRVAETETAMPSASAYTAQYTLPVTPSDGVGYSIDYGTEKITVTDGYEVNTDWSFGSGTAVEDNATLTANTTYYVRVAANGSVPASEAVSFAVPLRPETPTDITADKTKNSITIITVAGQEYKIGSGEWQDGGGFTALSADTEYTVYARVKAVSSGSVSFASEAYSATIKTKADGSSGFTLPTISVTPTYAPGKTLADISLPTGWAWSVPATVPTVTNSGYSAAYTPTDTDTVDYSDVPGYSSATGKITRTIALTVTPATPTAANFTYAPPTALTYDGTPKTATVTANSADTGAITVKYYLDGTETAPVNAGTYMVKIDVVQGSNYAASSAVTDSAWTFTIAKAASQAPLSITNKPITDVMYGDEFTLTTTGGSGTGAVTWDVTNGNSATVDASGNVTITGVGETTITATKAADGNYSAAATNTYTFTPAPLQLTVGTPSVADDWTKTYDGGTAFETPITVGSITNKVDADDVTVSVTSATYNTTAVGSNNTLTITYAIDGEDSGNYSAPADTVVNTASITAAAPTIALAPKTAVHTGNMIEIAAATVTGVAAEGDITADYADAISYTYYTEAACADSDKTTVDRSGANTPGGAPKNAGTYYVKAAIAASGNYSAAASAAVTLTIYYPSSGEANASTPVIVDGKTQNIGTEKKSGDTTTVTVDQSKLGTNIGTAASGSSVVVPVSENGSATASLMVQNIADMAAKGMTLTVQTGNVAYNLDTAAIDTAALTAAFPGADMSAVPFNVTITNSSVSVEGETLVLSPVAFTVTATYDGKTVRVDTFSAYIDRVLEVTAEQAGKITTAVVVNADGSVRHVPTNVIEKDGKYYAVVSSRTNSTYALIQNEVTFADAKGKWYEAAVNEMGSRKIIAGRSASVFDGEAGITRAEFAAILVRALGLPADGTSSFSDVSSDAWYTGAVATAVQYGLAAGKGENRFDPNASITRQEAMLMLQRAAALTEFAGTSGDLDSFADADSVGSWAKDAAKWSVGSGLIQGADGKLNPTANITRAESAAIILRLLQKAGLVDVRSEA